MKKFSYILMIAAVLALCLAFPAAAQNAYGAVCTACGSSNCIKTGAWDLGFKWHKLAFQCLDCQTAFQDDQMRACDVEELDCMSGATCSECGQHYVGEHSFGNAVWEWNLVSEGVYNAKVHATCSSCTQTLSAGYDVFASSEIEATCGRNAARTYRATLALGGTTFTDSRTFEIPNTKCEHQFGDYVSDGNAACTQDGTKTAKCRWYGQDGCSQVKTVADAGSAKGHQTVVSPAIEPTCTASGRTEGRYCAVCNAVLEEAQTIAATGHAETVLFAVAPTCVSEGKTEGKYCSTCQTVLVAQQTVPAEGHCYRSRVTAPTCTQNGYTTYTCTRCGHSYTADAVDALGHWMGEWMPTDDGMTSACRREGCEYVKDESCVMVELTYGSGDAQSYLSFCPICGKVDGDARLERIENARVEWISGQQLQGEAVLRCITAESGEGLLCAVFEENGTVNMQDAVVRFAVPLADFEGVTFRAMDADGETDLETVVDEDGMLSFELDFKAEGSSVKLIRVVSAE